MNESCRILRDLVAIPGVNPMGRPLHGPEIYEYRVTAYLEDFFRDLGVPWERQAVAPLRDNIVGRFETSAGRPTLLMEAHQDTVPTDNMTIDPFGAAMEQGRLSGRGACDIKGGMAAMLAAFARVVRDKPANAMNVTLACTVDEEHTFLGVQRLVRAGLQADMAVVAEPTQLKIVNAHKGVVRWHMQTLGRSCHSSQPDRGVNAIYRMAVLLTHVQEYAQSLRSGRADPLLGPATLSVGRIDGGTSANTVPDWCRIEIDRRIIPGEDARAAPGLLAAYLKAAMADDATSFHCFEPCLSAPALGPSGSEELVARLGAALASVGRGHHVTAVPYCTDASTIAEAGVPAVVFGPGDIAQAHTCDEWVDIDEVDEAAEVLYRLAATH